MQWKSLIVAAALAAAVPTLSLSQPAPDNGGGNPGGGPPAGGGGGGGNNGGNNGGGGQGNNRGNNRGNWDPAAMQQRMLDRMKTELAAQDDEWKVIEPKLKKVMDDQRELRGIRGPGGFGGPNGMNGRRNGMGNGSGGQNSDNPPPPEPTTPVAKAAVDLQASIKAGGADDTIDKKLSAYRDAREAAKTGMAADQKDLKSVLTAKQEATLVLMGMLD